MHFQRGLKVQFPLFSARFEVSGKPRTLQRTRALKMKAAAKFFNIPKYFHPTQLEDSIGGVEKDLGRSHKKQVVRKRAAAGRESQRADGRLGGQANGRLVTGGQPARNGRPAGQ